MATPIPPVLTPGAESTLVSDFQDQPAANDLERCKARRKVCRNPANNCDYRYKRGDPATHCPVCGYPRRCKNRAILGFGVCRMHGATPTAIKSGKYMISAQISAAFNRIVATPSLLNLSEELAIAATRTDQIMEQMQVNDPTVVAGECMQAANMIEAGILEAQHSEVAAGLRLLRAALDPVYIQKRLWEEFRDNTELIRRLSETERKWSFANRQAVPINQVLEFTVWLQQLMLRFIPSPADRAALAREIRSVFPVATAQAAGIRQVGSIDATRE